MIILFVQFTFASNTATILGGLLVGDKVQLRTISVFTYSFCMSVSELFRKYTVSEIQITSKVTYLVHMYTEWTKIEIE